MGETEENRLQEHIRRVGQLAERQQQIQKDLLDVQRTIYDLKRNEVKKDDTIAAMAQVPEQGIQPKVASTPQAKVVPALNDLAALIKPVKKEKTPI